MMDDARGKLFLRIAFDYGMIWGNLPLRNFFLFGREPAVKKKSPDLKGIFPPEFAKKILVRILLNHERLEAAREPYGGGFHL
jgi:hypothetical protein